MKSHHNLKATWIEGEGIKVTDPAGKTIEVSYGGTQDSRTVHAYVNGLGFIGGWNWPSPPGTFKGRLVASINQGILYSASNDLPSIGGKGSRGPRDRGGWTRR